MQKARIGESIRQGVRIGADPHDAVNKNRLLTTLAVAYCALKLVLLCIYAVHTQYVMDEYWQGGESLYIREFYGTYDPVKTVLYTYFYSIARLVTATSAELMRVARLQSLLLFTAMLVILWRTWRTLELERGEALLALCTLLSFSNVMERAVRVRSDHVALFFDVAAVAVVCRGNLTSRWRAFAGGALIGLAFLSTQKAAYAAVAMAAAMSIALWSTAGFRRAVLTGAWCLGGFLAALGAYALYFSGRGGGVLQPVMTRPMDLVLNADLYYPNMRYYVWQTLSRNWLPYLLTVAGLLIAAANWKRATPAQRFAMIFTAVFATLVFTNNQTWPYVFVSAIVFLAPWSVDALRAIGRYAARHASFAGLALVLCLSFSFVRNFAYLEKDNVIQNAVSDQAEQLLSPGDRYQDGLGMITTRRLAGHTWWDGMAITRLRIDASRGTFSGFAGMIADQPKVWILNYRTLALKPILRTFLEHSYVSVHRNILVSGVRVANSDAIFANRWTGGYAVYGSHGRVSGARITIDGAEVATPVRLSAGGVYRVRLATPSAEALFLLPDDLVLDGVEPVTAPPLELFEGVYE